MHVNKPYIPNWRLGETSVALTRRRIYWAILAIILTLTAFILLKSDLRQHTKPVEHHFEQSTYKYLSQSDKSWVFDLERDGLNFGLSEYQCETAFPDLYQELDRARDVLLKQNRRITEADVQVDQADDVAGRPHGEFHVLISRGELYVIKERKGEPDRSRGLAALANMYRAMAAVPDRRTLPDIEFVLDIEDRAAHNEKNPERIRWAWARHEDNPWLWVMPDFDGWTYPDDGVGSYVQFREDVAELESEYRLSGWDGKEAKLCWRGSLAVNAQLRGDLVEASRGHNWSDIEAIDWHNRANVLAMKDFCRFKYVAHTEGNSWSGRLRYLQNCDSVAVIHKLDYVFHYRHLLVDSGPHQNYVQVKRDWSDLETSMQALIDSPRQARQIALESTKVFRDRYLTPAAEACYWRRMFYNWRAVMDFEPRRYDVKEDGTKVRRGVSWERFAFRQKQSYEHGFYENDADDDDDE
ncbi:glycosyl transferase family 90-domain-containing protein [Whalleya microplaca]|nr:glycosyl transferase family 90-domain-containing protein [Whalleya microplaca]